MSTHAWYKLSVNKVFELLKTRKTGLTDQEVLSRQKKYGPNALPRDKRARWVVLLIKQFRSSLIYILLFAAGISLLLADYVDMYVILAAVLLNVIVGFIQEYRAMNAMAKLRQVVEFQTLVLRDSSEKRVNVAELVPGDIVILQPGDKIPADLRLIEADQLRVNEAKLTGESNPVIKNIDVLNNELVLADRLNMVFMGTIVTGGVGRGIVCATGLETEFGQIAKMIKETKEEQTPLQSKLDSLSKMLGGTFLLICLGIFLLGLITGREFIEIFTTAVAVAVAAIPEGLAVVVTVILAIGMQRILKQRGLVRKLLAAETLGSTTVICTDKTGTLTEGEMRVVRVITNNHDLEATTDKFSTHLKETGDQASFITALKIGVLCNDAHIENEFSPLHEWKIFGNPTEKALILAGSQVGLNRHVLEKVHARLSEIPFTSDRKFMLTLHRWTKTHHLIYLKGAPEKVLEMCWRIDVDGRIESLTPSQREKVRRRFEHLGNEGLRMIALAYKSTSAELSELQDKPSLYEDFIFVGLMGIQDPLRPEAKETISQCKDAGISIAMITGDHRLTAQSIARELGLPSKSENIIEGGELEKLNMTQLQRRVKKISVYARATPKDKLRIVDALQANGEVVAMTGDGVNDAPALRAADIGVTVGSGTDIAKETASLVILDNNFKTIVASVRQGRVVYENIRKVILYLLSDSFVEISIITTALIFGLPLPLLAAQILWINLITDGFPNIALTVEPEEREIMKEKPINRQAPILDREIKSRILTMSLLASFFTFLLFLFFLKTSGDIDLARTVAFASIGTNSLLYVFSCRSLRTTIFRKNPFSNPWLIVAVLAGAFLQLAGIYFGPFQNILHTKPLVFEHWILIATGAVLVVFFIEILKSYFMRTKEHYADK